MSGQCVLGCGDDSSCGVRECTLFFGGKGGASDAVRVRCEHGYLETSTGKVLCMGTSQSCMGTNESCMGTNQNCMETNQNCMGTNQDFCVVI